MGTVEIPLVALYTKRTGKMSARPPLLDLAHLNIKHWNEQSDQDLSVKFARVRLGFIMGVADDYKLALSADSFTRLPKDATVQVVQGSAESVTVGQNSLDKLIETMRRAGARLLQKSEGVTTKTATQSAEDALQEQSALGRMGQALEDAIDQVCTFMAEIESETQVGSVKVNGNFSIDYDPASSIDVLNKMAIGGSLAKQTVFEEAQRRGLVSDNRTWDEEQALINEQEPALGTMTDTNAIPPNGAGAPPNNGGNSQ